MVYWLDYSSAKLSGSVIKAAGYGGAIRYINAPNKLAMKHTTKAEYDSIKAAGLGIQLVKQNTTTDADSGYNGGVISARDAKAGADMLGYTGPIYFTNDRTTLPSTTAWDDYLTGAASVLGWDRVGAYGFANAMDVAKNLTNAKWFWQAGRRSDVRPFVHFWQDNNTQVRVPSPNGLLCDRNLVLRKEALTSMALTNEDAAKILDFGMVKDGHDASEGDTAYISLASIAKQDPIAFQQMALLKMDQLGDKITAIPAAAVQLSDEDRDAIAAKVLEGLHSLVFKAETS